mmetsp:Transcript_1916/g.4061  ORF Transcript_1916/g.4061 Transcript_1916/m.4061 type:complete len:232 (-) Transcript_1916:168-863(-)
MRGFQHGCSHFQLAWLHIVEHYDVSPSACSFVRLLETLALDFDLGRETSGLSCVLDCLGDVPSTPNVIVFKHNHIRQIKAMGGSAPDEKGVLFDNSEARSGLACAGHVSVPAVLLRHLNSFVRSRGDRRCARERVQCRALAEEYKPRWSADNSHKNFTSLGCCRVYQRPFLLVPLYGAPQRFEGEGEEGHSREYPPRLSEQMSLPRRVANDEPPNINRGLRHWRAGASRDP